MAVRPGVGRPGLVVCPAKRKACSCQRAASPGGLVTLCGMPRPEWESVVFAFDDRAGDGWSRSLEVSVGDHPTWGLYGAVKVRVEGDPVVVEARAPLSVGDVRGLRDALSRWLEGPGVVSG